MFVNLSHHASQGTSIGWSVEQREAAERIGGAVVDEPFPEVPPEASEAEIPALGDVLVERVLALQPNAAMVQGEFTLAFYVVCVLERKGVPCYAATTRRVVQTEDERGTLVKRSVFEFVRFRRYLVP